MPVAVAERNARPGAHRHTGCPMTLLINSDRLQADFDALSAIGAFEDADGNRGVNRPALSLAHLEARAWFLARAAAAGLETRVDAAGNHSAILRSASTTAAHASTLLLGSHLDSVPNGGRYDGALGVLAALEALRTVKEAGLSLPVDLEAIDFTDEEGTLVGELGSGALAGSLSLEALQKPRGGRQRLEDGLARAGLDEQRLVEARRDPASLAGYLELHIEQGPRLAQSAIAIGVVQRHRGYHLLSDDVSRHGQPCRHHAHGRAPRCRHRRRHLCHHLARAGAARL